MPESILARHALLPDGWARQVRVTWDDGRITDVRPDSDGTATADLLLPAPANLHSHAFQRAMAGLTEARGAPQDSFWTWRKIMYRFLDLLMPDDVQAIAAQVQMEMLEAGFAAVGEFHYLHHAPGGAAYAAPAEMAERIVAAATQTGIGLSLLPVLYMQGGLDGRALEGGQRRFGTTLDGFHDLHAHSARAIARLPADAVLGVAPHSLRAVSQHGLTACAALPGPLHMHLAEQEGEVAEVQAATGARPVAWLLDNCSVSHRWCLIHCTRMTPSETETLARTGAVAGLCPITESSLGDGIFNAPGWHLAKGRIGFGSDSNIRISLTEELRTLEYSQRLRDRRRAVLATEDRSTGRVLFDHAVSGGAQATGRGPGGIASGRLADLVSLDLSAADFAGRRGDQLLDTWIFATGDAPVADVWAAGRHVVKDGRHIHREDIRSAFRSTMVGLADRLS